MQLGNLKIVNNDEEKIGLLSRHRTKRPRQNHFVVRPRPNNDNAHPLLKLTNYGQ